jgi:hypothetical protein
MGTRKKHRQSLIKCQVPPFGKGHGPRSETERGTKFAEGRGRRDFLLLKIHPYPPFPKEGILQEVRARMIFSELPMY